MADDNVTRFCPECGARVRGPKSAFAVPQNCPKCSNRVQFRDYPNEPPSVEPEPRKSSRLDSLDYAAYACVGLGVLAGVAALITLLAGGAETGLMLGLIFLVLGAIPLAAFARFRSDLVHFTGETARLKAVLKQRDKELLDALEAWRGFKRNFDGVVEVHRYEILKETDDRRREADRRLVIANERETVIDRLGKRLLTDSRKWIEKSLTSQNFAAKRDQLTRVVDFCRKHEYDVPLEFERQMMAELKTAYEAVVRREHAKEEQKRIKEQIREEQRAEREVEAERKRLEAEQTAIREALEVALKAAEDEHSAEVEALRQKLREAEERAERAKSMAQLTKSGHIYVISNIGSFGDSVFKVGMTRRLEPMDRVKELGDASVPFPFDVHMMISCDDAPTLENTLHRALHHVRVNRVNLRKEFFRTTLDTIRTVVEKHHGEVDYVADPEALEYNQTVEMSPEDFEFITSKSSPYESNGEDE